MRIFGPVGFESGICPIDHICDVVHEVLDLFLRDLSIERRRVNLRFKLRAAMTDRFLFFLIAAIESLCPVVAVRFSRAFRGVAALVRFTVFGENTMANGLRYSCDFF